jgi:IPT/TIG domain
MPKRGRMRWAVLAWALASGLILLGQAGEVSAKADGMEPLPSPQEELIAEALAQGIITQADLNPPPAGLVANAVATVSKVAPTGGPLKGGQVVAVTGVNFAGASNVAFGDNDATSYAVASATMIVAKVPDADAGGSVVVKVTNADGTNTTGAAYIYGAPTVTKLEPAYGDPVDGGTVTITGTGFLGAVADDVKFGDLAALEVFVVSDTQMVATTPIDVADPEVVVERGVTDVVVTRNDVDSSTSANTKFLFSPGAPAITTLGTEGTPITGTSGAAIGALLTITGTDLWGVSKVMFGNTAVTTPADIVVDADGTSMTVKVPTRAVGPVDVTVTNVVGTSALNLSTHFDYIATVAPTFKSATPNVLDKDADTGGGSFLVTGTGFTGITAAKVKIKCTADITPDAVVVASDTSLIVTAPGNDDTAEACDLEIQNPTDNTKKVTAVDAIHYV